MKTLPVILAAALLLPACASSPPTHFVTLATVSPVGETVSALSFPVQVDAVHIPATIDRNAVVRLTGSNTLSIDDQDHWGAPLGEMTRTVLAQDLKRRLPARTVIMPEAPSAPNTEHIVVNIARFREEPHGQVRLKGSWTLLTGDPAKPVLTHDIDLECHASGSDADEQAAAMSQLVGLLSDRIARDLAAARAADLPSFAPLARRQFDSGVLALAGGRAVALQRKPISAMLTPEERPAARNWRASDAKAPRPQLR